MRDFHLPSRRLWLTALIFCLCASASFSRADEAAPARTRLINLNTATVTHTGRWAAGLDVRSFSGDEDLLYTSIELSTGIGQNLEVIARGSFADRKDFSLGKDGSIRHGGNDAEILLKIASRGAGSAAGLIGISFAGTPAQNSAALTLGATAALPARSGPVLFLNPRAIFLDGNSIIGFGAGAEIPITKGLAIVGDYTPVINGRNTRDTSTGELRRTDIYGVAVRYALSSRSTQMSIDMGYTNGLGSTTGFSLSPGLGSSGAFYAALRVRQ